MHTMRRREAMLALCAGCAALRSPRADAGKGRSRLGIAIYALGIHQRHDWVGRHAGLAPALAFLEECHTLGAGGIQCPLGPKDALQVRELRRRAESYEMHFEAIIDPPRGESDVPRFERDVTAAKECGADIARTVIMPGRRYERFKTLAEFREFEARGKKSLQMAEPILARHRFRLAVENHKDQLVSEKLAMLKSLSSEWIGLCLDVGNNLALLEDPRETVRACAPWAFTVHIKDAAVRECDEGFLLADAALGEGMLDLSAMVRTLRAAKPTIVFNLESITRDALTVPAKTAAYWASFEGVPRSALDAALAMVRANASPIPFPSVSALPVEQQLALERRNVEESVSYARAKLDDLGREKG